MTRSGVTGVTLVVLLMAGCRGPDAVPPLREDPALAAELQAEAAREREARERQKVLEAMSVALTNKFLHGSTALINRQGLKDPNLASLLSELLPPARSK